MKIYRTIDGTLIGFYRERGGVVQTVTYRDVYETKLVTKTREEEITIPGYYRIDVTTIEGFWDEEPVFIEGHYDRQMVWHPEYTVTRYREVPGHYETESEYVQAHYETQNIWVPEYYVTRYYWREAHPARGLEAAWIPYQHLMPAGYKDQRVWVEGDYKDVEVWFPTHTELYYETIPAGERETRVWVNGKYVAQKIWVPEQTTSERVWVPSEKTYKEVEFQVLEDVLIGTEPVYEYVDESQVRLFEVLELYEGAGTDPAFEDVITIRNMLTGEELKTTASYVGMATRIDENEYVVPN